MLVIKSSHLTLSDGRQNYPGYNIRYKDANFNNIKHLKGISMEIGLIKWENSLR